MATVTFAARVKSSEKLKAKIEEIGGDTFQCRVWSTEKSGSGLPSARVYVDSGSKAVAGLSLGGDGGLYVADIYEGTQEELDQLLALLADIGLPVGPNGKTKTKPQPKRAPKINF